jgi:hypothetical protein
MEEDSWRNLASSVLAFASQQSGIPGASEASQVILAMCGIEDEQATMLRRIQGDVALLRMGPFRAARVHLQTAERKGSAHPDLSVSSPRSRELADSGSRAEDYASILRQP